MKTNTHVREVVSGGTVLGSAEYHINPDHQTIVHVTQILRDLYSRPDLAVMREYATNALDAHQFAGVTRPIELHIPTFDEPFYSVRDFGGGLDREKTEKLLYGYGSSGEHKRISNDQIGGFGIGCKAAFSIASAFTYTIWHGGKKSVWSCYLDDHDMGRADLVSCEPSDEESGIEVNVPMKCGYGEQVKYERLLDEIFAFMGPDRQPKLLNSSYPIRLAPEAVLSTTISGTVNDENVTVKVAILDRTKVPEAFKSDGAECPLLVIGGTGYTVDMDQLSVSYPSDQERADMELRRAMLESTVIYAPVGLVQLAPSRETLKYSGITKKVLNALYSALVSDAVVEDISRQASSTAGNMRDRLLRHQLIKLPLRADWVSSSGYKLPVGLGYLVKEQGCKYTQTWMRRRGSVLGWQLYRRGGTDNNSTRLGGNPIGKGRTSPEYYCLEESLTEKPMVVIVSDWNDEEAAYKKAASAYLSQDPDTDKRVVVYCIGSDDGKQKVVDRIPWLKDGSVPVWDYAELPAANLGHFLDYKTRQMATPRNRGTAGPKSTQSSRKFVSLGSKYVDSPLSKNWEPLKAKDLSSGVFVKLEKFAVDIPGRSANIGRYAADRFVSLQKLFGDGADDTCPYRAAAKLLLPRAFPLLGVKEADYESVQKDPKFTTLWAYLAQRFGEDAAAGLIDPHGLLAGLQKEVSAGLPELEHTSTTQSRLLWFRLAKKLAEHPETANTKLGRRMSWWSQGLEKCTGVTQAWVLVLAKFTQILGGCGHTCSLSALLATNGVDILPWDKLSTVGSPAASDLRLFLNSLKGEAKGDLAIRGTRKGHRTSRLARDLEYFVMNHPMAFRLFEMHEWCAGMSADGTMTVNSDYWPNIAASGYGYVFDRSVAEKLLEQEHFFVYTGAVEKALTR